MAFQQRSDTAMADKGNRLRAIMCFKGTAYRCNYARLRVHRTLPAFETLIRMSKKPISGSLEFSWNKKARRGAVIFTHVGSDFDGDTGALRQNFSGFNGFVFITGDNAFELANPRLGRSLDRSLPANGRQPPVGHSNIWINVNLRMREVKAEHAH